MLPPKCLSSVESGKALYSSLKSDNLLLERIAEYKAVLDPVSDDVMLAVKKILLLLSKFKSTATSSRPPCLDNVISGVPSTILFFPSDT